MSHSREQENAVWDHFQKNERGSSPLEKLLVTIDSGLPDWGHDGRKTRENALTDVLARLQERFDSQQNWEVAADNFLTTIEGEKWSKLVWSALQYLNSSLIMCSVRSLHQRRDVYGAQC